MIASAQAIFWPFAKSQPLFGSRPICYMDLIAYFTSKRCKVRCADESRSTRWDGQKNEVITFSRDAKINTAASSSSSELQTALLICKTKKKVVVPLHSFLCILISRSLPNVKEMYMTAFRHKLIYNSITQSKVSRSIMTAKQQRSTPTGDYYITHSMRV